MIDWIIEHSTDFKILSIGLWILASVLFIAYIMGLIGNKD